MGFKPELKTITHKELGISEDEFNNFLIDLWRPGGIYDQVSQPKSEIPNPVKGETITVTVTPAWLTADIS